MTARVVGGHSSVFVSSGDWLGRCFGSWLIQFEIDLVSSIGEFWISSEFSDDLAITDVSFSALESKEENPSRELHAESMPEVEEVEDVEEDAVDIASENELFALSKQWSLAVTVSVVAEGMVALVTFPLVKNGIGGLSGLWGDASPTHCSNMIALD